MRGGPRGIIGPTPPAGKRALAQDIHVLRQFLPFLWPKGEGEIKARVVAAMACLVLAKLANAAIPILYGHAVDALGGGKNHAGGNPPSLLIAVPVGLIAAYGLMRVLSLAFAELRDAVFAKVAQRAIRRVSLRVFRHLHAMSLRFHLERQTGGLTRSIERGTNAIDRLLSFSLFNIVPTFVELLLAAAVLWRLFNVGYAIVALATVCLYAAYTIRMTNWRLAIRRQVNESDSRANNRAIDSLINHETVKYFTNEGHEADRFDEALGRYEKGSRFQRGFARIAQRRPIADHVPGVDRDHDHGGARHRAR